MLRGGILESQSDDTDKDDDEDILMYPANLDAQERRNYKKAYHASKASEWEEEQKRQFQSDARFGSSGAGGLGSGRSKNKGPMPPLKRSQSVRVPDTHTPPLPSLYKSSQSKQRTIKDAFSKGKIKEGSGRLVAKFFIHENVPPEKATSHHFKNMIAGAQSSGTGVNPPSPYEIRTKYLDMEVEEMNKYVAQIKPMWKTYGCTIMCDGWTGPTKLSIINFMVYCKGKTVFLKSVDASDKIKDHKYIYTLMRNVVQSTGSKNVVQLVIDNGSNYKKAGQLLMEKYNLYWTPCAAHCIDLIFERIADKKGVKEVITEGRMITNFIYNHSWLLAQMRACCGGDIVRPGATRFATNYIALDSLLKKKAGLKPYSPLMNGINIH
ncbi:hypothetical protein L1049_027795 [Liquidambar formosana]|uniref:DUF659 domain-containing protein n=1 Tax=Liquidambar formosana TaxID=63359 RepID=A0AAP0RJD8_LIQFO